jgi:iron complex outermembrane receptor protein
MPLTYDNAHSAKSYSLLSAKVGYRRDLDQHFHLDVFAGGNNLLGSLYYTMVFLNASYVDPRGGPIDPNVYLPGPYKATFYGGANLSYSL